jgi:3-oxoadipate enol-lactonase
MPTIEVSPGNSFAYEHIEPTAPSGKTFLCFNALSGDRSMWTQTIGPALQDAGHGLLIWNFRGQADTQYSFTETNETLIVDDAMALFEAVKPVRPVHVGLSIGGLFAIRAHERGGAGRADAIVLLNTLRKSGPRLDWVNDAVARTAEVGGLDLMRDLFMPLLMNQEWQAQNRANFLKAPNYSPADQTDGAMLLLKSGGSANWDVNYEAIDVPVLSVTGLQDRVFRDPDDIDDLSARIPKLTRVDLPNAGHMIPVERPKELSDAILNFASAIDG